MNCPKCNTPCTVDEGSYYWYGVVYKSGAKSQPMIVHRYKVVCPKGDYKDLLSKKELEDEPTAGS